VPEEHRAPFVEGSIADARDKAGDTPLQRAKNCRKAGVASLLISRGADARLPFR